MGRVLVAFVLVAASLPAATLAVEARTGAAPDDVEFRFTPFFWAAGLEGKVGVGRNVPTLDVDQSFSDIWNSLDFAAMLAGEYRRGRIGVLADFTYVVVSLAGSRNLHGAAVTSAELESRMANATATGFYRFHADATSAADALIGARLWHVSADVDASLSGLGSASRDSDRTWVDAVVGIRLRADLGGGFGVSGYGDIGGGASNLTWQLRGNIDYAVAENWQVHLGYRHLAVDYRRGGFVFDTTLSGPVLGLSYRF